MTEHAIRTVIRPRNECGLCKTSRAVLTRPADGVKLCRDCFLLSFEDEVHNTIIENKVFSRGERVAVGASGGKDSTVLAFVLNSLNKKYDYGIELVLVSIDEGIKGYRDDSLATVKENAVELGLPLYIVSYDELYGWDMDRIVAKTGGRNSCSYCGIFRRQSLDQASALAGCTKIAIGHNADDVAETVLMNLLRGDIARLGRSVNVVTGGDLETLSENGDFTIKPISRVKPLLRCYEHEIVRYAHLRRLKYHATECSYSPAAYRGFLRELLKDLEAVNPAVIYNVIVSAQRWRVSSENLNSSGCKDLKGQSSAVNFKVGRTARTCTRCGYLSSSALCQACTLLLALEAGNPRLALTKSGESKNWRVGADSGIMLGANLGGRGVGESKGLVSAPFKEKVLSIEDSLKRLVEAEEGIEEKKVDYVEVSSQQ